jgi:hypothetical protein
VSDIGYSWGDRVSVGDPFVFRGFNQEPQPEAEEEETEPTKGEMVAHVFNQTREEE